jgi:hypothetical protein
MRRHAVGVLAIVLLLGAAAFWVWPPSPGYEQWEAACWRLGAITVMLWLAYPELMRIPVWLLALVPVLAIVLARWPKWFLVLIPVLIVVAILKRPLRRR